MKRRVLIGFLFLLPVTILLWNAGRVAFRPGSQYTDLLVSHYPYALYIQQSLLRGEGVPFWSNTILSGVPLAANPLSGLHYPPDWLILLPIGGVQGPLVRINLLVALHLVWGGLGLFRLLRLEGLKSWPALLGGLAYTAFPKLYAHLGAGHVTLLYAAAWLPWLLAAERWSARKRIAYVLPGAVLGTLTLADPRMCVYAGSLWIAWKGSSWLRRRGELEFRGQVLSIISNSVFAALVAAPMLLPLAQFHALSTRRWMTGADNLTYSLPPGQLLGMLFPNPLTHSEWVIYPGAAVLALVVTACLRSKDRRRSGFWLVVMAVSILFAFGENLPLMDWIVRIPGLSMLRVPPRAFFLTGLSAAVIAAQMLDTRLQQDTGSESNPAVRMRKWQRLVLFAMSAAVVLFAAGGAALVDLPQARTGLVLGGVFWTAAVIAVLLADSQRISQRALAGWMIAICLLDAFGFNAQLLEFRGLGQVDRAGQALAEYILQEGQVGRVYSPSYSLPQQIAVKAGLELADGVDPLQIQSYAIFLSQASSVPLDGYSVTLPPFASGDPTQDNAAYIPDAERLGWLGVSTVVSRFPIDGALTLVDSVAGEFVYKNPLARPLAWVQQDTDEVSPAWQAVQAMRRSANQIEIQAEGPGMLVLAEVAYPGWRVSVDGVSAQPRVISGLLRGVMLANGSHTITWKFTPLLFFAGWALFVLAWIILLGMYRIDR